MKKPFLTYDIWHAAYLASIGGYTILGSVLPALEEHDRYGNVRKQFALIHPDVEKHEEMETDILERIGDFERDLGRYKYFAQMYRKCQQTLKEPVSRGDLR